MIEFDIKKSTPPGLFDAFKNLRIAWIVFEISSSEVEHPKCHILVTILWHLDPDPVSSFKDQVHSPPMDKISSQNTKWGLAQSPVIRSGWYFACWQYWWVLRNCRIWSWTDHWPSTYRMITILDWPSKPFGRTIENSYHSISRSSVIRSASYSAVSKYSPVLSNCKIWAGSDHWWLS